MHYHATNNKSFTKRKYAAHKTHTCDSLLRYPLEAMWQAETTDADAHLGTSGLWVLLQVRAHFHPHGELRWAFVSREQTRGLHVLRPPRPRTDSVSDTGGRMRGRSTKAARMGKEARLGQDRDAAAETATLGRSRAPRYSW